MAWFVEIVFLLIGFIWTLIGVFFTVRVYLQNRIHKEKGTVIILSLYSKIEPVDQDYSVKYYKYDLQLLDKLGIPNLIQTPWIVDKLGLAGNRFDIKYNSNNMSDLLYPSQIVNFIAGCFISLVGLIMFIGGLIVLKYLL